MANFAKLDNNNTVLSVITVSDSDAPTELEGINFLTNLFGYSKWKKTSYNTKEGIHYEPNSNIPSQDQSKSFRANFARVGWVYDEINDVFRDLKPENCDSWTLDTSKGIWVAPVSKPSIAQMTDGEKQYIAVWNNANNRWEATNDDKNHWWDSINSNWVLIS